MGGAWSRAALVSVWVVVVVGAGIDLIVIAVLVLAGDVGDGFDVVMMVNVGVVEIMVGGGCDGAGGSGGHGPGGCTAAVVAATATAAVEVRTPAEVDVQRL